ncbi:hypothetical protein [Zavarzinella formosa]|uniref:hypothetical protein n=1 Tax=Zavarzinella formosa TaxID=360055 RepID=UPI0003115730|nr:hypothetical protein [Zavarzinella formosa]
MNDFEDEYMKLVGWLHHAAEQTEAHIEKANRLIRTLGASGLLVRQAILGPVILQQGYHPDAERPESSQFVQIVLDVPRGIGIVRWDMDVHYELSQEPGALAADAPSRFVPFDECPVAVKALCFPHIARLLDDMQERLG